MGGGKTEIVRVGYIPPGRRGVSGDMRPSTLLHTSTPTLRCTPSGPDCTALFGREGRQGLGQSAKSGGQVAVVVPLVVG